MKPRPNWPSIRLCYLNNEGTLRELSARFGVPLRTLERKCSAEGWRAAATGIGGKAVVVANEIARAQGAELARLTADRLTEKTVSQADVFLTEVERRLATGEPNVDELRKLISGWRDVVTVGRTALGMDGEQSPIRLGISVGGAGFKLALVDPPKQDTADTPRGAHRPSTDQTPEGQQEGTAFNAA